MTPSTDDALRRYESLVNSEAWRVHRGCPRQQSPLDVSDLEQVGRIAVLKALGQFDGRGNLDAYLRQRVRWALLDEMRRALPLSRDQWRNVRTGRGRFEPVEVEAAKMSVAAEVADVIGSRQLRLGLMQLPPRWRHVLLQRYVAGKTTLEIAQELGIGESRVFQLQVKAKNQLRKWMKVPA